MYNFQAQNFEGDFKASPFMSIEAGNMVIKLDQGWRQVSEVGLPWD